MIRWGIIGTGNIAKRFIASLNCSEQGMLCAIASKNEETRNRFSHVKTYENYEDLLKDEDIDAVYIGLPHKMHAEWSIKALNHKKAVLCEKPAVLTIEEMNAVIEAAKKNNTFYMEAMKTRFTPAFFELRKVIESKRLGEILHIDVNFCSDSAVKGKVKPTSYLFEPGQGGSWNDVSSYLIGFVLSFYPGLPITIEATSKVINGIDYSTKAELEFAKGQRASMITALDEHRERTAVITLEKGKIIVEAYNRTTGFIIVENDKKETVHLDLVVDDFFGQIEEVHQCLAKGKIQSDIHSFDEMLRGITLMERIRNCALDGK